MPNRVLQPSLEPSAESQRGSGVSGPPVPNLALRSTRLATVATVCALVPLVLLGVLATTRASDVVHAEVTKRLHLTTALSSELIAEQLGGVARLVEASARQPRLVEAVADGNPANFDDAEINEQLATLASAGEGMAASGLLDLDGVLRGSPVAPELVGDSFSDRDYFIGLVARGETYISEAFQSAQAENPFILTIATYVHEVADDGSRGRPLAVVVGGVYLDQVQVFADEVAAVQGVNLWVADQRGTVLATPQGRPPELIGAADLAVGEADSAPAGEVVDIEVDDVPLLVVHEAVDPLGWTVYAAIETEEAASSADRIRNAVLAVGIPLALIVCAGIAMLVRSQRLQWRAEAALEVARDEADEASRLKSEFLSRMSHELRTPLNAVLGFAQVLELGELTAPQNDAVSYILKGGRHLLGLINEVLDISRIESGSLALSMEPVLVNEVVDEALNLVRPLTSEASIEIRIDTASSEGVYVMADRQRLKQILLNLLSNAIKYNRPQGSVAVSSMSSQPGLLQIRVSDTGQGLDPVQMSQLFVPFERLGAERTEIEGTGIGLALSYRLATAMGGAMDVESELGAGSTFWVELPTVEGQVERHERLNGDHVAAPVISARSAVHKVLYVEDNLANLNLVERVVAERADIELISCMQGSLGLDLAREHHPSLILLDLHLPDLSGEKVLAQLRADPGTAAIPVVIVSADATLGRVERLLAAGAVLYLTKPIDVRQLLRTFDDFLPQEGTSN